MRLVSWLVVAALLAAVGVGIANSAYHRGVAQGAAVAAVQAAPSGAQGVTQTAPPAPPYPYYGAPYPYYGAPYPYYGPGYYRPFGFFGFLFPLAFIFLAFAALRLLFRRRWGWARGRAWAGDCGPGGTGVPPMFEEWHRRAHEGTGKAEVV